MRPGNLKGLLKTDATQTKIIIKTLFFQEHSDEDTTSNNCQIYTACIEFSSTSSVSATNFKNRMS